MPDSPNPATIGAFNRQPADLNLLSVQKFRFQIRKLPNTNYLIQKAILPSLTFGIVKQPTPYTQLPVPGNGNLIFEELEIQFIVDEDMTNYFEIVNWMIGLGFPESYDQYAAIAAPSNLTNPLFGDIWSDAVLTVLSNESNANINIEFVDAFPVYLSSIQFDASDSQSDPQIATAKFAYARYNMTTVI